MDATMTTFLRILKASLQNEKESPADEISSDAWQKLFYMAGIHSVLPMFYSAAHASPALQQADPRLLASVKRMVMHQIATQTIRTSEFLELNQHLQAAGVTPLVVKGIICRNLYPQPDYRLSSDEDVLIPPQQFAACHRILSDFGMQTTTDPAAFADTFEIPYRKNGSALYIELHKQLFPPESDAYSDMNRFFRDAFARAIPETIQGNTVYTLEYTDHLFYLICHAFKHFLHSGFGIRQVCDIILYANRYGNRIDWNRILENCKAIRADQFAAALFQIGSRYLVFDPDKAAYPEVWRSIRVDEGPMLEDLLYGGLYGDASMSRKHSSSITLDAVTAQKRGRKAKNPLLLSAFPSAAALEGRYPYLKKHPYLLPVAWSQRIIAYTKETTKSPSSNAAEALKIGNERIELMKRYGILK